MRQRIDSNLSDLSNVLVPSKTLNDFGAVAALDTRFNPKTFAERTLSPLTAGGLRQSTMTLVQSSLGGGVLTLAFAMRLSGLGLGLFLLLVLGTVAFLGMDVMMRGAIELGADSTAGLLSKCVGRWSMPVMDFLLVVYGNGAAIAYFIFLGDFLPSLAIDLNYLAGMPPLEVSPQVLRTHCILATLILVVPLSTPPKLSALRFASPVALVAILFTAITVLCKCPLLFASHVGKDGFGEVQWFILNWDFFKAFSVLLFAYNCHLNVVPVTSELTDPSDNRIERVCFRVVLVEISFYALIATGGYLSFLALTTQNILQSYGSSPSVLMCRAGLSFTILIAIPTNNLPTIRSLQGLITSLVPSKSQKPGMEPLLSAGLSEGSNVLRLLLTAICLAAQVSTAIAVPNVADVMGLLGASVGTVLMMALPLAVLLKVQPKSYSAARFWFTASLLSTGMMVAFSAIVVMLQP